MSAVAVDVSVMHMGVFVGTVVDLNSRPQAEIGPWLWPQVRLEWWHDAAQQLNLLLPLLLLPQYHYS